VGTDRRGAWSISTVGARSNTKRGVLMARSLWKSNIASLVEAADNEARRRGDRLLGSEHLFLGVLHGPNSVVVGQALETDLCTARRALETFDR
jgi:hypothetical protein